MPTNLQYVIAATITIAHLSVKVPSAVIRSLTLTVATCSQLCNRPRRVKEQAITGEKCSQFMPYRFQRKVLRESRICHPKIDHFGLLIILN